MLIINPGTHADASATIENATAVAKTMAKDLGIDRLQRVPGGDHDGWFRFVFWKGEKRCEVDVPGDDPETVLEGRPFKARRLYVDGSSWLCGFAYGIIMDHLGMEA